MKLDIMSSAIIDTLPRPKSEDDIDRWYIEFQKLTKPYNDLQDKLKEDKNFNFDTGVFTILDFYQESKFYYFLEQSKKLNGHKFYFYPQINENEEKYIDMYHLQGYHEFPTTYFCSKLLDYSTIPFFDSIDKYPVRAIKELKVKSFKKIREDRIYAHADGFIISKELAKRFKEANFEGYELTPVKDCRSKKEHDNMFCLTATNILPPSEHNALRYEWQEKDEENKTLGYEGTIIYKQEALTKMQDFNYPCEATRRDGRADMLVSKDFKEFCEKEKIKGVDFIPVFTKESDLYKEYVQLVKDLCKDLVNSNPKHRIGFSKIDPAYILDAL